jgi:DNA-binding beta-propeller fold protein YncE
VQGGRQHIPNGDVWVADNRKSRVVEFNENGEFVREVGGFNDPLGVAVDADRDVWVADYSGNSIVELSGESGGKISQFGKPGSGNGAINQPVWVAADGNGNLWVLANAGGGLIQEFTPFGEYVSSLGGNFSAGSGIAVGNGFAYLEAESKVQKWAVLE